MNLFISDGEYIGLEPVQYTVINGEPEEEGVAPWFGATRLLEPKSS